MDYEIATTEVAEQPIISIRGRFDQQEIPAFLGAAFQELFVRLGQVGVSAADAPFVIYHEFGPHEMDAEVCVPVAAPVEPAGRIAARTIPGMTVARTLHVGPYDELGAAYIALDAWIEQTGLEAGGPLRERYLNGPDGTTTPAEYRTEVEIPIVAVRAKVPA